MIILRLSLGCDHLGCQSYRVVYVSLLKEELFVMLTKKEKESWFMNIRCGDVYCPMKDCTWTFFTSFELASHLLTDCKYGRYDDVIPCTHCHVNLKMVPLKEHWRHCHHDIAHQLGILYKGTNAHCLNYICNKKFKSGFEQCKEYLKHSIKCPPLFLCQHCNTEYLRSANLRTHTCSGVAKREARKSISKLQNKIDRDLTKRPKLSISEEKEHVTKWEKALAQGKLSCPVPSCEKEFYVPNHFQSHLNKESKLDQIFKLISTIKCVYCCMDVQWNIFNRHMQNNHRNITNVLNKLKIGIDCVCPNYMCQTKPVFTYDNGCEYLVHAISCKPLFHCHQCGTDSRSEKYINNHNCGTKPIKLKYRKRDSDIKSEVSSNESPQPQTPTTATAAAKNVVSKSAPPHGRPREKHIGYGNKKPTSKLKELKTQAVKQNQDNVQNNVDVSRKSSDDITAGYLAWKNQNLSKKEQGQSIGCKTSLKRERPGYSHIKETTSKAAGSKHKGKPQRRIPSRKTFAAVETTPTEYSSEDCSDNLDNTLTLDGLFTPVVIRSDEQTENYPELLQQISQQQQQQQQHQQDQVTANIPSAYNSTQPTPIKTVTDEIHHFDKRSQQSIQAVTKEWLKDYQKGVWRCVYPKCNQTFVLPELFHQHLMSYPVKDKLRVYIFGSKTVKMTCCFCQDLTTIQGFFRHIKNHEMYFHPILEKDLVCPFVKCQERFEDASIYLQHACNCPLQMKDRDEEKEEERKKALYTKWLSNFSSGVFLCANETCNKVFDVPQHLVRHLQTCTEDCINEFVRGKHDTICPWCNEAVNINTFDVHFIDCHKQIYQVISKDSDKYLCPNFNCSFVGYSLNSYQQHSVVCPPCILCEDCKCTFTVYRDLNEHDCLATDPIFLEKSLNMWNNQVRSGLLRCPNPSCSDCFFDFQDFITHLTECREKSKFCTAVLHQDRIQCSFCGLEKNLKTIVGHCKKEHIDIVDVLDSLKAPGGKVSCPNYKCKMQFVDGVKYFHHASICKPLYYCETCQNEFTGKMLFDDHVCMQLGDKRKKEERQAANQLSDWYNDIKSGTFTCPNVKCNQSFKTCETLIPHLKTCKKQYKLSEKVLQDNKFFCCFCKEEVTLSLYTKHMDQIHPQIGTRLKQLEYTHNIKCLKRSCRQLFNDRGKYLQHVISCCFESGTFEESTTYRKKRFEFSDWLDDVRQGQLCCPNKSCNEEFFIIENFITHLKNCKVGKRNINHAFVAFIQALPCLVCKKEYQAKELANHFRMEHTVTFAQLRLVSQGICVHCPTENCKQAFVDGCAYLKHIAAGCVLQNRYACKQCNQKFSSEEGLNTHICSIRESSSGSQDPIIDNLTQISWYQDVMKGNLRCPNTDCNGEFVLPRDFVAHLRFCSEGNEVSMILKRNELPCCFCKNYVSLGKYCIHLKSCHQEKAKQASQESEGRSNQHATSSSSSSSSTTKTPVSTTLRGPSAVEIKRNNSRGRPRKDKMPKKYQPIKDTTQTENSISQTNSQHSTIAESLINEPNIQVASFEECTGRGSNSRRDSGRFETSSSSKNAVEENTTESGDHDRFDVSIPIESNTVEQIEASADSIPFASNTRQKENTIAHGPSANDVFSTESISATGDTIDLNISTGSQPVEQQETINEGQRFTELKPLETSVDQQEQQSNTGEISTASTQQVSPDTYEKFKTKLKKRTKERKIKLTDGQEVIELVSELLKKKRKKMRFSHRNALASTKSLGQWTVTEIPKRMKQEEDLQSPMFKSPSSSVCGFHTPDTGTTPLVSPTFSGCTEDPKFPIPAGNSTYTVDTIRGSTPNEKSFVNNSVNKRAETSTLTSTNKEKDGTPVKSTSKSLESLPNLDENTFICDVSKETPVLTFQKTDLSESTASDSCEISNATHSKHPIQTQVETVTPVKEIPSRTKTTEITCAIVKEIPSRTSKTAEITCAIVKEIPSLTSKTAEITYAIDKDHSDEKGKEATSSSRSIGLNDNIHNENVWQACGIEENISPEGQGGETVEKTKILSGTIDELKPTTQEEEITRQSQRRVTRVRKKPTNQTTGDIGIFDLQNDIAENNPDLNEINLKEINLKDADILFKISPASGINDVFETATQEEKNIESKQYNTNIITRSRKRSITETVSVDASNEQQVAMEESSILLEATLSEEVNDSPKPEIHKATTQPDGRIARTTRRHSTNQTYTIDATEQTNNQKVKGSPLEVTEMEAVETTQPDSRIARTTRRHSTNQTYTIDATEQTNNQKVKGSPLEVTEMEAVETTQPDSRIARTTRRHSTNQTYTIDATEQTNNQKVKGSPLEVTEMEAVETTQTDSRIVRTTRRHSTNQTYTIDATEQTNNQKVKGSPLEITETEAVESRALRSRNVSKDNSTEKEKNIRTTRRSKSQSPGKLSSVKKDNISEVQDVMTTFDNQSIGRSLRSRKLQQEQRSDSENSVMLMDRASEKNDRKVRTKMSSKSDTTVDNETTSLNVKESFGNSGQTGLTELTSRPTEGLSSVNDPSSIEKTEVLDVTNVDEANRDHIIPSESEKMNLKQLITRTKNCKVQEKEGTEEETTVDSQQLKALFEIKPEAAAVELDNETAEIHQRRKSPEKISLRKSMRTRHPSSSSSTPIKKLIQTVPEPHHNGKEISQILPVNSMESDLKTKEDFPSTGLSLFVTDDSHKADDWHKTDDSHSTSHETISSTVETPLVNSPHQNISEYTLQSEEVTFTKYISPNKSEQLNEHFQKTTHCTNNNNSSNNNNSNSSSTVTETSQEIGGEDIAFVDLTDATYLVAQHKSTEEIALENKEELPPHATDADKNRNASQTSSKAVVNRKTPLTRRFKYALSKRTPSTDTPMVESLIQSEPLTRKIQVDLKVKERHETIFGKTELSEAPLEATKEHENETVSHQNRENTIGKPLAFDTEDARQVFSEITDSIKHADLPHSTAVLDISDIDFCVEPTMTSTTQENGSRYTETYTIEESDIIRIPTDDPTDGVSKDGEEEEEESSRHADIERYAEKDTAEVKAECDDELSKNAVKELFSLLPTIVSCEPTSADRKNKSAEVSPTRLTRLSSSLFMKEQLELKNIPKIHTHEKHKQQPTKSITTTANSSVNDELLQFREGQAIEDELKDLFSHITNDSLSKGTTEESESSMQASATPEHNITDFDGTDVSNVASIESETCDQMGEEGSSDNVVVIDQGAIKTEPLSTTEDIFNETSANEEPLKITEAQVATKTEQKPSKLSPTISSIVSLTSKAVTSATTTQSTKVTTTSATVTASDPTSTTTTQISTTDLIPTTATTTTNVLQSPKRIRRHKYDKSIVKTLNSQSKGDMNVTAHLVKDININLGIIKSDMTSTEPVVFIETMKEKMTVKQWTTNVSNFQFTCPQCHGLSLRLNSLARHMKSCMKKNRAKEYLEAVINCPECPGFKNNMDRLIYHFRTKHILLNWYLGEVEKGNWAVCQNFTCAKYMDKVEDIRDHCKNCGYLWRCKYCAVEYDKESVVRRHKCRDSNASSSSENENNVNDENNIGNNDVENNDDSSDTVQTISAAELKCCDLIIKDERIETNAPTTDEFNKEEILPKPTMILPTTPATTIATSTTTSATSIATSTTTIATSTTTIATSIATSTATSIATSATPIATSATTLSAIKTSRRNGIDGNNTSTEVSCDKEYEKIVVKRKSKAKAPQAAKKCKTEEILGIDAVQNIDYEEWAKEISQLSFSCRINGCLYSTFNGFKKHLSKNHMKYFGDHVLCQPITCPVKTCSAERQAKLTVDGLIRHLRLNHLPLWNNFKNFESDLLVNCSNYECNQTLTCVQEILKHFVRCKFAWKCGHCKKVLFSEQGVKMHYCEERQKSEKRPRSSAEVEEEFPTKRSKRKSAAVAMDLMSSLHVIEGVKEEGGGGESKEKDDDDSEDADFEKEGQSDTESEEYEDDDDDEGLCESDASVVSVSDGEDHSNDDLIRVSRNKNSIAQFVDEPFFQQWLKDNQSKEVIFPMFLPEEDDLQILDESSYKEFLPHSKCSPYIEIEYRKSSGKATTPLTKLELFQSMQSLTGSSTLGFYCGGPIWGLDWCPTHGNTDQFLAVTCSKSFSERHCIVDVSTEAGMIQIWKFGELCRNPTPKLVYGICHNYGPIFQVKWCPESYTDEKEEIVDRLGLLAAACGDGKLRIFCIPKPKEGCDAVFCHLKPCAVLIPRKKDIFESTRTGYCLCLSWQPVVDHRRIAAGFGDGSVCIWDVLTNSLFLKTEENDEKVTLPITTIFAHSCSVRSIAWCPYNKDVIATGSSDKSSKIFNINQPHNPIYVIKRGIIFDLEWPKKRLGFFASEDDCFNIVPSSARYMVFEFFIQMFTKDDPRRALPTSRHTSAVWSCSYNNHLDLMATGDAMGEVIVIKDVDSQGTKDYQIQKKTEPVYRIERIPIGDKEISDDEEIIDADKEDDFNLLEHYKANRERNLGSFFQYKYKILDSNNFEFSKQRRKKDPDMTRACNVSLKNLPDFGDLETRSINKVVWNENYGSHTWLASGTRFGIVRLHNFKAWSST